MIQDFQESCLESKTRQDQDQYKTDIPKIKIKTRPKVSTPREKKDQSQKSSNFVHH